MGKGSRPEMVELEVAPSPDAPKGLAMVQRAQGLVIIDRESHAAALEMIKGAKSLRRAIGEHWSRIKRSADEMKRRLLDLERADVAPLDQVIAILEPKALEYQRAEERRAREVEERERARREEAQRLENERRAAEAEAEAQRLEESSPALSERETAFVREIVSGGRTPAHAAEIVGFKNPEAMAERLTARPKIRAAIVAESLAMTLREEAERQRAAPVDVEPTRVERKVGKVAGVTTRTTYGAEVVDLLTLVKAVAAGQVDVSAVEANMSYLNVQAKALAKSPGAFERLYPGCRTRSRDGIAG